MAISLFTPINYLGSCSSAERVLSALSHYFFLADRATVIRGNILQIADNQTMQGNPPSWYAIALKVASYILLFPITALAFATYLYLHFSLRSQYSFAIISNPIPTFPASSEPPAPRKSAQRASATASLAALPVSRGNTQASCVPIISSEPLVPRGNTQAVEEGSASSLTPPAPRESVQGASVPVSLAALLVSRENTQAVEEGSASSLTPPTPLASVPVVAAPRSLDHVIVEVRALGSSLERLVRAVKEDVAFKGKRSAFAFVQQALQGWTTQPLQHEDERWMVKAVYTRQSGGLYTIVGRLERVDWETMSVDWHGFVRDTLETEIGFCITPFPNSIVSGDVCHITHINRLGLNFRMDDIDHLVSIHKLPYTVQSVRAEAQKIREDNPKMMQKMRDAVADHMPSVLASLVEEYVDKNVNVFPEEWGQDLPPEWRDFLIASACEPASEATVE